jgi:hypothetical protein
MNKRINILENRVSELHGKLYQDKKEEFEKDSIFNQMINDEIDEYTNR